MNIQNILAWVNEQVTCVFKNNLQFKFEMQHK